MLHHCLLSIAGQSRKDLIKEVIVSENSDDTQSGPVANAFSDQLPIRYFQQIGGIPQAQHMTWLTQQAETKYGALICDDDMWSSYHIEEAMRSFKENPTIHSFLAKQSLLRMKLVILRPDILAVSCKSPSLLHRNQWIFVSGTEDKQPSTA